MRVVKTITLRQAQDLDSSELDCIARVCKFLGIMLEIEVDEGDGKCFSILKV